MDKSLSTEDLSIALELANIISGAASSTLAMLVDPDIRLDNPEVVEVAGGIQALEGIGLPEKAIMAILNYTNGLESPACYVMDQATAKAIADVMMASQPDGSDNPISDMQLSAVGEALSQMMGAAANSMSQFLSQPIDISAPDVGLYSTDKLMAMMPEIISANMVVMCYTIKGSSIIPEGHLFQITPLAYLQHHIAQVQKNQNGSSPVEAPTAAQMAEVPQNVPAAVPVGAAVGGGMDTNSLIDEIMNQQTAMASTPSSGSGPGSNPPPLGVSNPGSVRHTPSNPVTVQPVEFQSFDNHVPANGGINKNLELVMDVSLNLTVELGRTELSIKDVLELTRGSVIELNRVAGESVDLFANGKMIAKGEVVVIEDNFGLRITSIVSPADRLRGL